MNCNIYEITGATVLEKYTNNVSGDPNCTIAVVSENVASDAARNAIMKSAEKLEFGINACAWIHDVSQLEDKDLVELIEGIAPIAVVLIDETSVKKFAASYNEDVNIGVLNFNRGRPTAAFKNFEEMLLTDDGKQLAWSILRQL